MLADVVDRDHVRVGEPRQRLSLPQQPRARVLAARAGARVLGAQQLERDLAVELGIVGGVRPTPSPWPRGHTRQYAVSVTPGRETGVFHGLASTREGARERWILRGPWHIGGT